ncbi:hypothetical protein ACGFXC_36895 [Streptomyces sp. NPDC048507]|uniref:hypothetical protein n=1 Tax=Streptomyces sp. NPDC048507 TaxID=3365560 RepID=UPI003717E1FC
MTREYRQMPDGARAEVDALLTEAGYDEWHQQRPAPEIKERVHCLLTAAAADGRLWAADALTADALDGHLRRFRRWDRVRQVVPTAFGDRVVKRARVLSVQRRAAGGPPYYQGVFLEHLTLEEARAALAGVLVDAQAVQDRFVLMGRLVRLMEQTGTTYVGAGLAVLGVTLDEYLLSTPEAA